MPPKRIKPATAGAPEDCVLPEDVLLCIFTRLPVKSIYRFKSVSKPWCKIFSSTMFRKMRHAQFPQSILIYGRTANLEHTMSLLRIESDEKTKPIKLDNPPHQVTFRAELIGCCSGLLCTAFCGRFIFLWNPALDMSKGLPLPDLAIGHSGWVSGHSGWVSLGFGYDEEADNFKVVRVVSSEKSLEAEVYSADSDSWSTIDVGFQFTLLRTRNDVIVNGNPYWKAVIDEKGVLVCFDVREMVFKIVPVPNLNNEEVDDFHFLLVDLKGNLGALVCDKKNVERVFSLDIWVFDDVGKTGWTKNRSFGTIELKVEGFLQCFENGKILVGECLGEDGKVIVFDTENGGVKEIVIDEAERGLFQIYGYTESLTYIKGMKKPQMTVNEYTERMDDMDDKILWLVYSSLWELNEEYF